MEGRNMSRLIDP